MAADFDNMSDEDFIAALEQAAEQPKEDTEPELEAPESDEEPEMEEEESIEEDEPSDSTGSLKEDDGVNSEVENTPGEEVEEAGDTEGNEGGETEESDSSVEPEGEPNYKEQYAKLQQELQEMARYKQFYDQVTGEFVANGRKMKGFDDPQKIIQAQQMAAGFAEKMAGFKKYKPFVAALKERGLTDDPDKFNFALNLLEGDKEALKAHIKSLGIDPMELDLEQINYQPKNVMPNDVELALDETLENAAVAGVDNQVKQVIQQWDDESVLDLLEDPQSRNDLVNHLSTGIYDIVQRRIMEKRATDVNGIYTAKPMIEQYREAAFELENEYMQWVQQRQMMMQQQQMMQQNPQYAQQYQEPVQQQMNPSQQQYMQAMEQQQVQNPEPPQNEQRKRAARVSKKKPASRKAKKETFDPAEMSDEEFTAYLDSLIYK